MRYRYPDLSADAADAPLVVGTTDAGVCASLEQSLFGKVRCVGQVSTADRLHCWCFESTPVADAVQQKLLIQVTPPTGSSFATMRFAVGWSDNYVDEMTSLGMPGVEALLWHCLLSPVTMGGISGSVAFDVGDLYGGGQTGFQDGATYWLGWSQHASILEADDVVRQRLARLMRARFPASILHTTFVAKGSRYSEAIGQLTPRYQSADPQRSFLVATPVMADQTLVALLAQIDEMDALIGEAH